MKSKKIRGHRRRWKAIDRWAEAYKHLDLDYLKEYQRDYAKIRVHPWSGISITNSQIAEPNGETRTRILNGLIEIYDAWKQELDKLGERYYLKIWLFEPRFSNSQVVCAIGKCLDFYEHTFFNPEDSKKLKAENYGRLENEISKFNWEHRIDEDSFDNFEPGDPDMYATLEDYEEEKRWYQQRLKKPHRTTQLKEPMGAATEIYSFKKGEVWLGEK